MTFKKKHKLGFVSKNDEPLDRTPLSIKLKVGNRDKIKAVPDWQDRVRELLDGLIKDIENNKL